MFPFIPFQWIAGVSTVRLCDVYGPLFRVDFCCIVTAAAGANITATEVGAFVSTTQSILLLGHNENPMEGLPALRRPLESSTQSDVKTFLPDFIRKMLQDLYKLQVDNKQTRQCCPINWYLEDSFVVS